VFLERYDETRGGRTASTPLTLTRQFVLVHSLAMKHATKDGLKFVLGLVSMPFVLLSPILILREVWRSYLDVMYANNPNHWFARFMVGSLLGLVATYLLLFLLIDRILSERPVVTRESLLGAMVPVLVFGGYYLYAVTCVGWSRHEEPEPYDVARNEVYAAFLDNIGSDGLLIQDDTRPIFGNGQRRFSPLSPVDNKLRRAADEASLDYDRRSASVLPVGGKLKLSTAYQYVPHGTASMLFGEKDTTEVCQPFKQSDTLVVLSPVGFNSDQTLAGIEATVIFQVCAGPNLLSSGWSGPRMFRKQCGKWKPVSSEFFADVTIG
jgi:hypothetical protein